MGDQRKLKDRIQVVDENVTELYYSMTAHYVVELYGVDYELEVRVSTDEAEEDFVGWVSTPLDSMDYEIVDGKIMVDGKEWDEVAKRMAEKHVDVHAMFKYESSSYTKVKEVGANG